MKSKKSIILWVVSIAMIVLARIAFLSGGFVAGLAFLVVAIGVNPYIMKLSYERMEIKQDVYVPALVVLAVVGCVFMPKATDLVVSKDQGILSRAALSAGILSADDTDTFVEDEYDYDYESEDLYAYNDEYESAEDYSYVDEYEYDDSYNYDDYDSDYSYNYDDEYEYDDYDYYDDYYDYDEDYSYNYEDDDYTYNYDDEYEYDYYDYDDDYYDYYEDDYYDYDYDDDYDDDYYYEDDYYYDDDDDDNDDDDDYSYDDEDDFGSLEVHFIDVGQGDAILIKTEYESMLIDAGNNSKSLTVLNYLKSQKVDELKYVISSNAGTEHCGGLDVILDKMDCETVLMSTYQSDTDTFQDFISALKRNKYKAVYPFDGVTYELGDASFTIVGPINKSKDRDSNSVSILLTHGEKKFLLTSDAEAKQEAEMIESGLLTDVDVIKAGKHGSMNATSMELLKKVSPEYCVITCGADNAFGYPHASTLANLKELGIKVFRTDEQGTIVAKSDGAEITWSCNPSETWKAGFDKDGSKEEQSSTEESSSTEQSSTEESSSTEQSSTEESSSTEQSSTEESSSTEQSSTEESSSTEQSSTEESSSTEQSSTEESSSTEQSSTESSSVEQSSTEESSSVEASSSEETSTEPSAAA